MTISPCTVKLLGQKITCFRVLDAAGDVVRVFETRDEAAQWIISGEIIAHVGNGMDVKDAVDAVCGAGTFLRLAGEVYDALRAKA